MSDFVKNPTTDILHIAQDIFCMVVFDLGLDLISWTIGWIFTPSLDQYVEIKTQGHDQKCCFTPGHRKIGYSWKEKTAQSRVCWRGIVDGAMGLSKYVSKSVSKYPLTITSTPKTCWKVHQSQRLFYCLINFLWRVSYLLSLVSSSCALLIWNIALHNEGEK